jgi:hypothetical protein
MGTSLASLAEVGSFEVVSFVFHVFHFCGESLYFDCNYIFDFKNNFLNDAFAICCVGELHTFSNLVFDDFTVLHLSQHSQY